MNAKEAEATSGGATNPGTHLTPRVVAVLDSSRCPEHCGYTLGRDHRRHGHGRDCLMDREGRRYDVFVDGGRSHREPEDPVAGERDGDGGGAKVADGRDHERDREGPDSLRRQADGGIELGDRPDGLAQSPQNIEVELVAGTHSRPERRWR